jgi:hypothetical protein
LTHLPCGFSSFLNSTVPFFPWPAIATSFLLNLASVLTVGKCVAQAGLRRAQQLPVVGHDFKDHGKVGGIPAAGASAKVGPS